MQDLNNSATAAFESLFIEVIALAGRLKRPLLPQGADLDVGPHRVLQVLAHEGPLTVPQIGRLLGTSRQNIQVIVNRLKTDGWVEIVLNPAHERSVLIQATQSGKSLVTPSLEEETRIFGELNTRFPNSQITVATSLLHEIRQRLGEQKEHLVPEALAASNKTAARQPKKIKQPSPASIEQPSRAPERFRSIAPDEDELPISLL